MSSVAESNASTKAKSVKQKRGKIADTADRHVYYQLSVQNVETEIDLFIDKYRALRGSEPMTMREDFCGTALLSLQWCKTSTKRRAIGVDLCSDTLAWAQKHNLSSSNVASRVSLLNDNVLTVKSDPVDLICAMNFSYCVFKQRDDLKRYFQNVRAGLNDNGVFFLDLLGGTVTMDVCEEEREIDDGAGGTFTYIWDQDYFNPINHELKCYIHFRFSDRSELRKAFFYDWRLWTLPELKDVLLEAGFSKVHFFWETFVEDADDPKAEYMVGTGDYEEVTEVEQQESWLAYIVAEK